MTSVDTTEQAILCAMAVDMARALAKLPPVLYVEFALVPHPTDDPPCRLGPQCRLLVVVSDELADEYLARLRQPLMIEQQEGTDDVAWWEKRPEWRGETAFHLLGTTEENVYDGLGQYEISPNDVRLDQLIDVVLVAANWQSGGFTEIVAATREFTGGQVIDHFDEATWCDHASSYRRYDPMLHVFV